MNFIGTFLFPFSNKYTESLNKPKTDFLVKKLDLSQLDTTIYIFDFVMDRPNMSLQISS